MTSLAIYESSPKGSLDFAIRDDGVVFSRTRAINKGHPFFSHWSPVHNVTLAAFIAKGSKIIEIRGITYYRRESSRLKLPEA